MSEFAKSRSGYIGTLTMLIRFFTALLLAPIFASCSLAEPSFDIRDADRPAYSETLVPEQIDAFLSDGGLLIDVRLEEDFQQDPRMIPGAVRVDPEDATYWQSLEAHQPVAVYCVKGKWVSQKVGHYVSSLGNETYSLEGGLEAYDAMLLERGQ